MSELELLLGCGGVCKTATLLSHTANAGLKLKFLCISLHTHLVVSRYIMSGFFPLLIFQENSQKLVAVMCG